MQDRQRNSSEKPEDALSPETAQHESFCLTRFLSEKNINSQKLDLENGDSSSEESFNISTKFTYGSRVQKSETKRIKEW